MAELILPRRFKGQPQYPAQLDLQGLAKGAQFCVNPAVGPIDLINNRAWSPNGNFGIVATPAGRTLNFDGSASFLSYTGYPEISGSVGTFALWFPRVGAASTFGHVFFGDSSVYFQVDNAGKINAWGSNPSSGAISWFNTVNRSLVFVSRDGTASGVKVYLDGIDTGFTFPSNAGAFSTSSKSLTLGRYVGGASWDVNASLVSVAYLSSTWGNTEVKAFHESKGNALYKAPARRLWVVRGSGSTGTVSYVNANDTLSGTGKTTVIGTLAKTNAKDTSVASGSTTVTGILAKTNANDSVSASGSVGSAVSGTLNYTNANDTAAASGKTTVTGSLSKTNANDSCSAAGTTTIVGALAKTNANDSVSASGTVTGGLSGTVAYTNKNDTLSASGTTTILGTLAKTNANDGLSGSGIVNNGVIVESALVNGIAAAARIKKPGIPSDAPEWLRTVLETVIGRRGNAIDIPKFQTLTFSATPTKAECEALYAYLNNVRQGVEDILTRLDG